MANTAINLQGFSQFQFCPSFTVFIFPQRTTRERLVNKPVCPARQHKIRKCCDGARVKFSVALLHVSFHQDFSFIQNFRLLCAFVDLADEK